MTSVTQDDILLEDILLLIQEGDNEGLIAHEHLIFKFFKGNPETIETALSKALEKDSQEIVSFLLPFAQPRHMQILFTQTVLQKNIPMLSFLKNELWDDPKEHLSGALASAVHTGDLPTLSFLLPFLDPKHQDSEALSLAAHFGFLDMVRLLLPVSDANFALFDAAREGHLEAVKLILPNVTKKDFGEEIAEAISRNKMDVVDFLLNTEQAKTSDMGRAVYECAKLPTADCLFVLEKLFTYINPGDFQKNKKFIDIFNRMASHKPPEVLQFLMPFGTKKAYEAALLSAANRGQKETVENIFSFAKPSKNIINEAFKNAAAEGHLETVRFLLPYCDPKNGSKSSFIEKITKNTHDRQAVTHAATRNHLDIVKYLAPFSDMKANSSEALQRAVINKNEAMIDFLYPLSDPKAALRALSRKKHIEEHEYSLLRDIVASRTSKKELTEAIATQDRDFSSKKPRKM